MSTDDVTRYNTLAAELQRLANHARLLAQRAAALGRPRPAYLSEQLPQVGFI